MKKILATILLFFTVLLTLVPANAASGPSNIVSDAWVVIEAESGQVLAGNNIHKKKYPASITKILTGGIACEAGISFDKTEVVSKEAIEEIWPWGNSTTIALEEGEIITFRDALYTMLIVSANDSANATAQFVTPDISDFPELMNQKVEELGLEDSHFTNAHGLPDNDHYTSAYDMAMITRWALTVDGFEDAFCCTEYVMPETNLSEKTRYGTYHHMLVESAYQYDGAIGGKLGWTSDAHHTCVTLAERDGMRLICVTLDCTNKWQKYIDTAAIFDYCFDNLTAYTFPRSSLSTFEVPIVTRATKKSIGSVSICFSDDFVVVADKNSSLSDFVLSYEIPDYYYYNGEIEAYCIVTDKNGNEIVRSPMTCTINIDEEHRGKYYSTGSSHSPGLQAFFTAFQILGIVLLSLVLLFLLLRLFFQSYYKIKKRRRKKKIEKLKKEMKK